MSVGLDIGQSFIKMVALQQDLRKQRYRLVSYAVKNVAEANEENREQVIVDTIKKLYHEARLDEKKVRVTFSDNSFVVRYVSLPKMTPEEAKKCVKYEGDQHIPFSLDEVEIDCDVIDNNGANDNGKLDIILAAVRKESCQKLLGLLDKAGLTPVVIDVDSIAVINAFTQATSNDEDQTVALVHIGTHSSDVSILHNNVPVFTRNIEIGGSEFTSAICKGLGIETARAEELKIFGDIVIRPFIEGALETMARHLRSSFDYYEGASGTDVNKLYLSGGGTLYEDTRPCLESALGLETHFWDPFSQIDTTAFKFDRQFESVSRMLAVAVGLAIRRMEV